MKSFSKVSKIQKQLTKIDNIFRPITENAEKDHRNIAAHNSLKIPRHKCS